LLTKKVTINAVGIDKKKKEKKSAIRNIRMSYVVKKIFTKLFY